MKKLIAKVRHITELLQTFGSNISKKLLKNC